MHSEELLEIESLTDLYLPFFKEMPDSMRLVSFKERTFPWAFQIHYVEGDQNAGPDFISRNPAKDEEDDYTDFAAVTEEMEVTLAAAVRSDLMEAKAVMWERVMEETVKDETLEKLKELARSGFPEDWETWPERCKNFFPFRKDLYEVEGVVLWKMRVVIPKALQWEVLENIHSAHQGCGRMYARAGTSFFWPNLSKDIDMKQKRCQACEINMSSHQSIPAEVPTLPEGPFQQLCWPDVRETPAHPGFDGLSLVRGCRELFATFGVAEEISSDGGPQFVSGAFKKFTEDWGVKRRQSLGYNPQSNGRAEVAVKVMKRILTENVSESGSLDTDKILKALLCYKNTPDESGLSPAMILMGRQLRDSLPAIPRGGNMFENENVAKPWREMWAAKEIALADRLGKGLESLNEKVKILPKLEVGQKVRVQDLNKPKKKWQKSGTIVQVGDHHQYLVRLDGSRRVVLRNRKFLRAF